MRARTTARLTLDDLTINEMLCLSAAWRPDWRPAHDVRWTSWRGLLDVWEHVRSEALAAAAAGDPAWAGEIHAEQARQHAALHGVEALDGWRRS